MRKPSGCGPMNVGDANEQQRGYAMSKEKPRVYAEAEIPAKLKDVGLTEWKLEDGWLRRKYNTDGWRSTLMLVNAIGFLAEAADHHPDLSVSWAKIWVKLSTHS